MALIQRGTRFFFDSASQFLDEAVPVGPLDSPQRVCLKDRVPQNALYFKVSNVLFRGVADVNGNTDVALVIRLPGQQFAGPDFDTWGEAAVSHDDAPDIKAFPPGTLYEPPGFKTEIPNMTEGADWAVFYWMLRGVTLEGAKVTALVNSFELPPGETPNFPAQPLPPVPSLLLNFAGDFIDSSPAARTITSHGVGLLQGGGASFDGAASYLSFNGSDPGLVLTGDFTIEVALKTAVKSMQGNVQRRILSFGTSPGPSIGIGINPATGAVELYNEYMALLKAGSISIATNANVTVKWSRQNGVNTLFVGGQPDGASFNDGSPFAASGNAEIGRLNGQALGQFSGEIHKVSIIKGAAV